MTIPQISDMVTRLGLNLEAQRRALDSVGNMTRDELADLARVLLKSTAPFIVDLVEDPMKPFDLSLVSFNKRGLPLAHKIDAGDNLALFLVPKTGVDPATDQPATFAEYAEIRTRKDAMVSAVLVDAAWVVKHWSLRVVTDAIFLRLHRGLTGTIHKIDDLSELTERLRITRRLVWDRPLLSLTTERIKDNE